MTCRIQDVFINLTATIKVLNLHCSKQNFYKVKHNLNAVNPIGLTDDGIGGTDPFVLLPDTNDEICSLDLHQNDHLGLDYMRRASSVDGLARQTSQLTSMVYST